MGHYVAIVQDGGEATFVQFPRYRKDVIKLKILQGRFMRLLPGLDAVSYREWLDRPRSAGSRGVIVYRDV